MANPALARAIFSGVKDVENRQKVMQAGWYAVYLTKASSGDSSFGLPRNFADLMAAKGVVPWTDAEVASKLGCILGLVRLGSPTPSSSPWRMMEIGREAHPTHEILELPNPIPVRPMSGVWALPTETLDALVASILQQEVAEALRCASTETTETHIKTCTL